MDAFDIIHDKNLTRSTFLPHQISATATMEVGTEANQTVYFKRRQYARMDLYYISNNSYKSLLQCFDTVGETCGAGTMSAKQKTTKPLGFPVVL